WRAVPGNEDRRATARTEPPRRAVALADRRPALSATDLGDDPRRARAARRRGPASAGVAPGGAPRRGGDRNDRGPGARALRAGLPRLGGDPLHLARDRRGCAMAGAAALDSEPLAFPRRVRGGHHPPWSPGGAQLDAGGAPPRLRVLRLS